MQAKANQMTGALKTVRETHSISSEYLSKIAAQQVRSGDVPAAFKTLKGVYEKNSRAYGKASADGISNACRNAIAVQQARSGDIPGALKSVEGIGDASYKASALTEIALIQAGVPDTSADETDEED